MASITHKGNPVHTVGSLPKIGQSAADFRLVAGDLSDKSLKDYAGKKKILNIVPSLDTGVCAQSAKTFNQKIAGRTDTVVLTISRDLVFAQQRFCQNEGIDKVVTLSDMRQSKFGADYGVTLADGLLEGLFSRAIVLLDKDNKVVYTEQVPEIGQEPDYDSVLAKLNQI